MTPFTVTEWVEKIGRADATDCSAEKAAAYAIFNELRGYRHSKRHILFDTANLANALEAYALMLQRAGLKIHDPEKVEPL